jgi:alpha-tubulin suppressor-like RCC1 family protein
VFSVGYNENGQLGNSNNTNCKEIKEIEFFKNLKINDIKSGFNHSLAISKDGEIYAWGNNDHGEIGKEYNKDQLTPIKIYKLIKIY